MALSDNKRGVGTADKQEFGKVWELSEGDNPISGELLQLDLAAQSVQDNSRSTSGINVATLDLAGSDNLPHYRLMHYPTIDARDSRYSSLETAS